MFADGFDRVKENWTSHSDKSSNVQLHHISLKKPKKNPTLMLVLVFPNKYFRLTRTISLGPKSNFQDPPCSGLVAF